MNNTCVMCGNPAELPEDTWICPKCQRGAYPTGKVRCPNCGCPLEVMDTTRYNTSDGFVYSTLYHCNECHTDWEKEEEYVCKPVIFKRKFWGQ